VNVAYAFIADMRVNLGGIWAASTAPDSSSSGGEGGGCGCACEEATGRKPPQPLQPPANQSRPTANGRKWRKKTNQNYGLA